MSGLYLLINLTALICLIYFSLICIRYSSNNFGKLLLVLMTLASFWILSGLLQLVMPISKFKIIVHELKYISISFVSLTYLLMVIEFKNKRISRKLMSVLILVNVLFIIMIFTNNYHNLFRYDIRYVEFGPYMTMESGRGILFWIFLIYQYSVMCISLIVLFKGKSKTIKEGKIRISLTLALLFPWIVNFVYVLYIDDFIEDLTPAAFIVTGAIMIYSFVIQDMLNVVPMALNSIFSDIDDAIVVTDASKTILDFNERAVHVFSGISHYDNVSDYLMDDYKMSEIVIGASIYEKSINTLLKGKKIVGYIYYFQDITELRQLELENMLSSENNRKEIIEKDIILNDLITVSRENIFKIFSEINALKRKEECDEYIDMLENSAIMAFDQIKNIEDLTKIEKGNLKVEYSQTNLIQLVNELINIYTVQASKNDVLIEASFGTLPDFVEVDSSKLRQVLSNLINNSIKFTKSGNISLKVYMKDLNRIGFIVKDSGIGISYQDMPYVFEPFRQVNVNYVKKGTGVGLTIVKDLVESMGGRISVSSEINKGSKFKFDIECRLVNR